MTTTNLPAPVVLTLADGEAREAKTYPLGDYSCPFCSGAVISPAGFEYGQQLNAEHYAKLGEAYEIQPYPQYMRDVWEARGCANPACRVLLNAEQLAEARERIARREAEEAARRRNHELAMERIRQSREAEAALWDELRGKAEAAGQCVRCLRRSYWQTRPKFVRHRDPANCPNAHR